MSWNRSEASQRTVANNDNISRVIPAGTPGYVFAGQGFHITGDGVSNSTYGMSYVVCETADDPECLGGDDETDSVGCRSLHTEEMAKLTPASSLLALLLHVHRLVRGRLQVQRDCPRGERFVHELIVRLTRCFNPEGVRADH